MKGDQRDIDMMNDPERWPGEHLCVKRYVEDDLQCSVMDQNFSIFGYDLKNKVAQFNSAKEAVDAGWMVD